MLITPIQVSFILCTIFIDLMLLELICFVLHNKKYHFKYVKVSVVEQKMCSHRILRWHSNGNRVFCSSIPYSIHHSKCLSIFTRTKESFTKLSRCHTRMKLKYLDIECRRNIEYSSHVFDFYHYMLFHDMHPSLVIFLFPFS